MSYHNNRDIIENTCIDDIERSIRLIQPKLTPENNITLIKHLITSFSNSHYISDKCYLEDKAYYILSLIDEFITKNPSFELIECKDKLLIYYNRWFNNISNRKNIMDKLRDSLKYNLETYLENLKKRFTYIDSKFFREYYTKMSFYNEEICIFMYYILWRLNENLDKTLNEKDIKFIVKMVSNSLSKCEYRDKIMNLYQKTLTLEETDFSKQLNSVICLNLPGFRVEDYS